MSRGVRSRAEHEAELLFDSDCGFCTRAVGVLRRIDRKGRVRILPLQSGEALAHFGVTQEQALMQVWALDPRGGLSGGAEAVNVALSAALGIGAPLWLYRLPGVGWCQERVYRAVAANRYRLPGSSAACSVGTQTP